jgi:hypothetical protein
MSAFAMMFSITPRLMSHAMMQRSLHALRAPIACMVLWMAIAMPANADDLGALQGQIVALQVRLDLLEPRVQNELPLMRVQIDILNKDVALLKHQVLEQGAILQGLQNAFLDHLKEHPAEPGNPPSPSPAPPPGPKPSDNPTTTFRTPFIVKDAAGRIVFKVDTGSAGPRAVIGDPAGNRVEIGAATGGSSVVELFDGSSTKLSALVADPKGSYVRVKDNEQSALLGNLESDGRGLILRKGAKEFLTLTPDKAGAGVLKLFGTMGSAVGGMYADSDGGHLILTGPAGGKTVVGLAASPTGGKVRVYPADGGTTRAELVAEGPTGAVNLFASDGTNVASLASLSQTKSGHLQLGNGVGNTAVEAGASRNGAGYVSAGPFDGGVAGAMGTSGMQAASSLLGRLKAK